ncbi:hypothetical protein LUZ60_014617 [Juncus effusus]|nr:hypothetical protein LUZ60_014617 [Juncus effusus]
MLFFSPFIPKSILFHNSSSTMAKSQNPFKFLVLSLSLLLPLSSAAFSPSDDHLVACGATAAAALDDHRVFLPDSECHTAHIRSYGPRVAVSNAGGLTPLHQTARVFTRPASYQFVIKEKGTHIVRLHFYPFSSSEYDLSSALFHVAAGEFSLLANFSTKVPVLKEFIIPIDSDKISLTFIPAQDSSFAFVNAIEIISAPKDLIGQIATLIKPNQTEKFNGLSSQSFETIYRLNIGGKKITPFNDSLWRTWLTEQESSVKFTDSESKTELFTGRINYLKFGASREVAPDSVYDSARLITDSNQNLSWAFNLSPNDKYLVRLHFCDIASLALDELYFNIYINGNLGKQDFDLSQAVNRLATPYYIDYITNTDNSGLLNIIINPSNFSEPNWVQGLLNGLEVFKMNKTERGMDEEIPVAFLMVRRGIGEFVKSVLCGFVVAGLLVGLVVLGMRWRTESRGNLGWSEMEFVEGKLGREYQMVPKFEI